MRIAADAPILYLPAREKKRKGRHTAMPLHLATSDHGLDQSGTPMLILHGLFGAKKNWGSLQKQFARRRPVVAADLRNHGESPWDDAMHYEAMAEDLAHLIETRLEGRKAAVVGHSMGGKASMMLALERPDLVERLCVVDIAPAPTSSGGLTPYVEAMRDLDLSKAARRGDVDAMLKQAVPDPGIRAFLLTNLAVGADGLSWQPNLDVLAAEMPRIEDFPETDDHDPYEGPTLFIAGGKSDYIGPQHQAEIERLFPRAEIETIDGAGHWVHAEQPKAFMQMVEDFLEA